MPKGIYQRKKVHREINRNNALKKKTSGLRKYVFERDDNTCLMCGKKYPPNLKVKQNSRVKAGLFSIVEKQKN